MLQDGWFPSATSTTKRAASASIASPVLRLKGPDRASLDRTRQQLRELYTRAYDWEAPELDAGERLSTTRLRQYVRRWINEWDLLRLYPRYTADTVLEELHADYSEEPELEQVEDTESRVTRHES